VRFAGKLVNHACNLLLKRPDALQDNLVWLEAADCFDVEEEAGGDSVEIKGLAFLLWATIISEVLLVYRPVTSLINLP
jgi:hypothetical protein